jgi:hypothetical protein
LHPRILAEAALQPAGRLASGQHAASIPFALGWRRAIHRWAEAGLFLPAFSGISTQTNSSVYDILGRRYTAGVKIKF